MHTFITLQMVKVKRLLTETLLEVTNDEIRAVATEVYQRARKKHLQGRFTSSHVARYLGIELIIANINGLHDLIPYSEIVVNVPLLGLVKQVPLSWIKEN